jgi:hypothetical protein
MDTNFLAASISAVITIIGIGVAYAQWRRDVQVRLESLREEVTVELVRQRVKPYSDFITKLERMSTIHRRNIEKNPKTTLDFIKVFQEAIYSPVGLFASSDTREIMVYARLGCKLFAEGAISYDEWLQRIWAVHYAVRSDLGIAQPAWPSEIERLREQVIAESSQRIIEQVESMRHLRYDEKADGSKASAEQS